MLLLLLGVPDPLPVELPDPLPVGPDPDPLPVGPEPLPVGPDPLPVDPDPLPVGPDPLPVGPDPLPVGPDPLPVGPDPPLCLATHAQCCIIPGMPLPDPVGPVPVGAEPDGASVVGGGALQLDTVTLPFLAERLKVYDPILRFLAAPLHFLSHENLDPLQLLSLISYWQLHCLFPNFILSFVMALLSAFSKDWPVMPDCPSNSIPAFISDIKKSGTHWHPLSLPYELPPIILP